MQRRCYTISRRLDYIASKDLAVCDITADAHTTITTRGDSGNSFIGGSTVSHVIPLLSNEFSGDY
jgi:hypothetical protein